MTNTLKYFFTISMVLLMYTTTCNAQQETAFYTYKNEIGINATTLLGNMLSLTNNATPYGAFYCRHYKKGNIRIGTDILYDKTDNFDFIGNLPRSLIDGNFNLRLSFEKNKPISEKFMMHYGVDVSTNVLYSYSIANNISNEVTKITPAIGPALRLVYKLHNKMYVTTESMLYGSYGIKTQTLNDNGFVTSKTTNSSSFKLTIPTSLFISIHF